MGAVFRSVSGCAKIRRARGGLGGKRSSETTRFGVSSSRSIRCPAPRGLRDTRSRCGERCRRSLSPMGMRRCSPRMGSRKEPRSATTPASRVDAVIIPCSPSSPARSLSGLPLPLQQDGERKPREGGEAGPGPGGGAVPSGDTNVPKAADAHLGGREHPGYAEALVPRTTALDRPVPGPSPSAKPGRGRATADCRGPPPPARSGSGSEGNLLLAAGLANLDAVGPPGDHLHSDRACVVISSPAARAQIAALLLTRGAASGVAGRR
jgi:hypothetical protein